MKDIKRLGWGGVIAILVFSAVWIVFWLALLGMMDTWGAG